MWASSRAEKTPMDRSVTVAASMRGPLRVNIFLSRPCPQWSSPTNGRRLRLSLVFPSKERFCFSPPTRPASIRTLSGAVCSGASWSPQSQIGCCHLSTELSRPVSGDARSAATSQSPELGDGFMNYIVLGRLLRRPHRLAVAQCIVHFSGDPQPVQQHRQLPRHRHNRTLLRILAAAGG